MLNDGTISKNEFEQLVECDVKCQLESRMEVGGVLLNCYRPDNTRIGGIRRGRAVECLLRRGMGSEEAEIIRRQVILNNDPFSLKFGPDLAR